MNDSLAEKSDDAVIGPININISIAINKLNISSLFIYANGFITFNKPYYGSSSIPQKAPINKISMIFPLWTDLNILRKGDIYYREIKDNVSLSQITNDTDIDFVPAWAFVITYYQIAPHRNDLNYMNTFQLVLASNGTSFYSIFNFEKLYWHNWHSKQPIESGYSLDNDHYHLLSLDDLSENSNTGIPGKYVFRLDRPISEIEYDAYVEGNSNSNEIKG